LKLTEKAFLGQLAFERFYGLLDVIVANACLHVYHRPLILKFMMAALAVAFGGRQAFDVAKSNLAVKE
jgi:hypothetical protein